MTPAKLPESLNRSKPRVVAETKVGDHFAIFAPEMIVDPDGGCYIYADAKLMERYVALVTISVERREDGLHVITHPDNRWERGELPKTKVELIPVASITVKG